MGGEPTARPRPTTTAALSGIVASALAVAQVPAPAAAKAVQSSPPSASMATLDRFEQAAQIARLAADHAMFELSAEAIRDSLGVGPPVVPIAIEASPNQSIRRVNAAQPVDPSAQQVEQRVFEVDAAWSRNKMPPGLAYEALRAAVLPDSRPGEVFLYPRPLSMGDVDHPRSVGAILARRAVEAGRVDDLRRRIEARQDRPMAAVPSQVLAVQLALASKDDAATARLIAVLADRLKKDSLQNTAELACHAAIPALEVAGVSPAALPMVEAAASRMAVGNQNVVGPLLLTIARRKFKNGQPDEARATLKTYLDKMQETGIRYAGDYSLFYRKQALAAVAAEFARAGRIAETWEVLGQFADAPTSRDYGADPEIGGAISRAVRMALALPAPERYATLKGWSLPSSDRRSVRSLAAFAPEDQAVPGRFGPMPAVDLRGVASTLSLLIEAARESGKLGELADEASRAAEAKVENARPLLTLVRIAQGRASEVEPALDLRAEELTKLRAVAEGVVNPNRNRQVRTIDWNDYLIARDAMADPKIGEPAARLASALIADAEGLNGWVFVSRLNRELALRRASRAGQLAGAAGADPGLASWHPSSLEATTSFQQGSARPLWVESGGIVGHVAGPQFDLLPMDFPLAGTFEVTADTFLDPRTEGQLSFSGLVFGTDAGGAVFPVGLHERKPVAFRYARVGEYNRLSIRVEPGRLRVTVNGHLFHEETDPSPTSPWLAFYAGLGRRAAFRDVAITGSPEIPREVRLSHSDRLEGWSCGFYGETQPPRRSVGQPINARGGQAATVAVGDLAQYDWHAKDGVIVGRGQDTPIPGQASAPGRIYYVRPLRDGESISYEFLHEPGKTTAHPTLDRLAFLIEPEGVKLHWMTGGGLDDWTGLAPDNVAEAPECRRGPVPLPLKPGEWNKASIRLEGGVARLELNGVPAFEYPLEPGNSRVFGFFHDKRKASTRVREVVLRGDWPTALPADLLARRDPDPAPPDRLARGAMIEDRYALLASESILAGARKLPPDRRYEALARYVLPGPDHPGFRVTGRFTPVDPPPPLEGSPGSAAGSGSRLPSGGVLEGPATELLATARALNRLDELADRIEQAQPKPPTRPSLAMLALARLAQGKDAEAVSAIRALMPPAGTIPDDEPEWGRWPELVAASSAVDRPATRASAVALLDLMDSQWKPKAMRDWGKYVRATRDRAETSGRPGADPKPEGWAPVTIGDASSRGRGLPFPTWTFADGAWSHHPGHSRDHLFLTSPIAGDFEVDGELTSFDWRETQLSYGSITVAIEWNKKSYSLRQYGQHLTTNPIDPPFAEIKPWYAFKLSVKDGTYRASVDGRMIHETKLAEPPDPWLAIGTFGETAGGARNLRISGKPVIPGSLRLSARPDLTGWLADYYGEPNLWKKSGEEIVGPRLRDPSTPPESPARPAEARPLGLPGSKHEAVLKYVRPMLEDGEITYEFFHEPGKTTVHPALGRLAFLIEPDGVKLHRITDAQHDRTGLDPGNASVEPDRRRGPAGPPLRPGAWNRLRLATAGDTVTITLNDTLLYERPIEPTNQREFGLFRFADETEARVRNVDYRGDWPRALPPGLMAGPSAAIDR